MWFRGSLTLMDGRTRRSAALLWTAFFVFSLMLQYASAAAPSSALAAHDEGLFELDGNATASAAPGDDWSSHPNALAFTFVDDPLDGKEDNIFTTGDSKDDLNSSDWRWTIGNVPDKDNIDNAYAAAYTQGGDTFVYFGLDRHDNNGDAQVGFWFFKNGLTQNANGTFAPAHTVGDLLVVSHFTNGGTVSTIELYEWVGSGGDTNNTLDFIASGLTCTNAPAADQACAIANAADTPAPWAYTPKSGPANIFPANSFFEGGINLTGVFGEDLPCFSSFLGETRSSQSIDAVLKDFALGSFDTCGSVTIVKNAVPDDAQDFAFASTGGLTPANFSLDDDADGALSNTRVFTEVNPGQYTVTEAAVPNWQLTGLSCNDGNSTVNLGTRTATINVEPVEDVVCTFTNTRYGRIIVEKQTLPDGSSQSFEFDPSWGPNFNLTDGQQNNSGLLAPGMYSVAEVNLPAGWDLTSATCSDGSPVNAIDLALNETVTCVFTNRQDGRIITAKETLPDGSPQSFEFDPSWGPNFNLMDGQQNNSGLLDPDTYSVVELVPAGWDLSNVSCSDGSLNTVINLGPGETVTCTFNNRQDGRIVVEKQTTPDGSNQTFEFDPSWGPNFSLTDGQQNNSGFLDPGTYSVAEVNLPAGWDLTSATCSDGSPVNAIDLAPGEVVTCVFNNRQDGRIITVKQTNPDGDPAAFEFDPSWGPNFNLTDGQQNNSAFLDPGTYAVSEIVPAGWDLTSATCSDGSPVNAIDLGPGETVTCLFTNTKRGQIVIDKVTNPAGDPASFEFDPSYGPNFNLTDAAAPNASGPLVPGTYTVQELALAGWDLTSLVCVDPTGNSSVSLATRTATIDLGPGETVTCTFTNTKRGQILVDKVTNPANDPASFEFDPSYGPNFNLTHAAAPNDSGPLVPGTYTVQELALAGWDLTGLACFDPSGNTSVSLATRTATIDLGPGETVTCTFTNTKRGTIIVEKQTAPDGAPGSFGFSGDAAGSIGDNGTIVVSDLVPGTYTSVEADPAPDFDLGAINCDDGASGTASSGDVGTRTATFRLDPGETVKCTFTNVQRGTITIIKNAIPDGPQDFAYTTTGAGLGNFSLDDDADGALSNMQTFQNVAPGAYSVTELATAGWDLTGLTCVANGDGTSAAPNGATATMTMAAGGSIVCTYENTQRGRIIVEKQTLPDGATQSFDFTASYDADGFSLSDGQQNDSGDLVPDTYSVAETVPPTWVLASTSCSDGSPVNFIAVDPGEVVTCVFTNRQPDTDIDKGHDDADGVVGPGQTVTYSIDVEVVNGPIANAVITDTLPDGQTYVDGSETSNPAATFAITPDGKTLTWTYLSLGSGDPAATITYQVTIDGDAPTGDQVNTAQVCADVVPDCETDTALVRVPDLTIAKDFTGNTGGVFESETDPDDPLNGTPEARVNDTLTYTLTYTLANGPVTNGVITDTLPDGLAYISGSATASDPGGEFTFSSYDATTRTLMWNAPSVTTSGSVRYQVVVSVGADELPQPLVNVAAIDSDETEPREAERLLLVEPLPLVATATPRVTLPPTSTIDSEEGTSGPAASLMLVLLAIAGLVLAVGFVTPSPERLRRRTRR